MDQPLQTLPSKTLLSPFHQSDLFTGQRSQESNFHDTVRGLFGMPSEKDSPDRVFLEKPNREEASPRRQYASPPKLATPNCPPPINLGADSVPRFPTPDGLNLGASPMNTVPFPSDMSSPLAHRGQSEIAEQTTPDGTERKSLFGGFRLRNKPSSNMPRSSKSKERKSNKSGENVLREPTAFVAAMAKRERRLSLSEKLVSVLRRKKTTDHVIPPLPSRSEVARNPERLDGGVELSPTKSETKTLARSASSPNLSRQPRSDKDRTLPAMPFALSPIQSVQSCMAAFATMPMIDHPQSVSSCKSTALKLDISASTSPSFSSLPSLSPSSSQSASIFETSLNTVSTPNSVATPNWQSTWPAVERLPLDHSEGQDCEQGIGYTDRAVPYHAAGLSDSSLQLWDFLPDQTPLPTHFEHHDNFSTPETAGSMGMSRMLSPSKSTQDLRKANPFSFVPLEVCVPG